METGGRVVGVVEVEEFCSVGTVGVVGVEAVCGWAERFSNCCNIPHSSSNRCSCLFIRSSKLADSMRLMRFGSFSLQPQASPKPLQMIVLIAFNLSGKSLPNGTECWSQRWQWTGHSPLCKGERRAVSFSTSFRSLTSKISPN
ncbi:hypothetical protein MHYP_G00019750 [Metynnis hypsauchen]